MILDAGVLIAVDRGERAAQSFLAAAVEAGSMLGTSAAVVAQVWRDGSRQARLARFLNTIEVHDFTRDDAFVAGGILLRSATSDVVDAHIVALAVRLQDSVITADSHDFLILTSHLGARAPRVHRWNLDAGGPVDVVDMGFAVLTTPRGEGRRRLDDLLGRDEHAAFVRSLSDDPDLATT